MIAASDSRSASVTRSIEFDLRLTVILLRRFRWILPAARAARSAICSISFSTEGDDIPHDAKRPARGANLSTDRASARHLRLSSRERQDLPAGGFGEAYAQG